MSANEAKGRLLESGVEAKVSSRLSSVQAIDRAEGERYGGGGGRRIYGNGEIKREVDGVVQVFFALFFFFLGELMIWRWGDLVDFLIGGRGDYLRDLRG